MSAGNYHPTAALAHLLSPSNLYECLSMLFVLLMNPESHSATFKCLSFLFAHGFFMFALTNCTCKLEWSFDILMSSLTRFHSIRTTLLQKRWCLSQASRRNHKSKVNNVWWPSCKQCLSDVVRFRCRNCPDACDGNAPKWC